MRLVLVRHGEAYAGFDGVIAGPTGCTGLTPHGRRQAEALRDELVRTREIDADVLVASVIPRAIETAEIIAPGLGFDRVERDCDLCEVHTGEADGLPWAEYPSRYGALDMTAEPDRVFAPGGESWNGFHERVERTMRRLAAEHRGSAVVAVCHAGVIQASLRTLLGIAHPGTGDPGTGARIQPANTGLTVWEHDDLDDRWTLHTFNQATHLAALARHDATGNRR